MRARVSLPAGEVAIDLSRPIDISIPLDPHGPQPSCYGAPRASARPYSGEGFVLDTRRGGSCNCEEMVLIPHCNGTHTECAGHITEQRVHLRDVFNAPFSLCALISCAGTRYEDTTETSDPAPQAGDRLVTRTAIESAFGRLGRDSLEALAIRTLPNSIDKRTRDYMTDSPPYLSREAMLFVRELGVRHLLVDLPSVDRMFDEGRLTGHHVFWEMQAGSSQTPSKEALTRTITEMIFVPDEVGDGIYMLCLQIGPLESDASPSRPLLFELLG